jgi:hypothetical protein
MWRSVPLWITRLMGRQCRVTIPKITAPYLGGYMRWGLVAVLALVLRACASNLASDEPGTRIHDTTLTAKDTTNPNDTLPHIRGSMPDTTR